MNIYHAFPYSNKPLWKPVCTLWSTQGLNGINLWWRFSLSCWSNLWWSPLLILGPSVDKLANLSIDISRDSRILRTNFCSSSADVCAKNVDVKYLVTTWSSNSLQNLTRKSHCFLTCAVVVSSTSKVMAPIELLTSSTSSASSTSLRPWRTIYDIFVCATENFSPSSPGNIRCNRTSRLSQDAKLQSSSATLNAQRYSASNTLVSRGLLLYSIAERTFSNLGWEGENRAFDFILCSFVFACWLTWLKPPWSIATLFWHKWHQMLVLVWTFAYFSI